MKLWQLLDAQKQARRRGEASEVERLEQLIERRIALMGGAR